MILKKPYIILIKYFRLIHLFLGILIIYSIYKINELLRFFDYYLKGHTDISLVNLQDNMFNIMMFIVPILILVISFLLLWLMIKKKKPFRFYLFNFLVFLLIIIALIYIYNYMGIMNQKVVDILIVRSLRDILIILMGLQSISILMVFIRTVGFDIKNFEFMSDLNSLELSDEDLEEFEVDFNFDSNERKRKRNKYLRFLKYSFKENKVFIIFIIFILLGAFGYILYKNINVYSITNKENKIINSKYYDFSVLNSYLVNENSRGYVITDNYLLVVDLKIKSNKLDNIMSGSFKLMIGDNKYNFTNKYDKFLSDIGNVYNNDYINNSFKNYLFVFEIPKDLINSKMYLIYYDDIGTIKVRLNPIKFSKEIKEYKLGEILKIDDNDITIDSFELSDMFINNYKYCNKGSCYDSIQYLVPSLDTNYDKAIIKIIGTYNSDNGLYGNLGDIISGLSYIEYDNYFSGLQIINDIKGNNSNIYYFEVNKDIMSADSIKLIFNSRKCKYVYNLK